jgi:hypothetical protein
MSGNCIYCGKEGKYFLKWKKSWCCESNWARCPVKRNEKNKRL